MHHPSQVLKAAAERLGHSADLAFPQLGLALLRIQAAGKTHTVLNGNTLPILRHQSALIAQHKHLLKAQLHALAIPTPKGIAFPIKATRSQEDDARIAETIADFMDAGQRYAAKPATGSGGQGINLNILTADDLIHHLDRAAHVDGDWVLEEFVEGHDLGLLVLNGKIVSAVARKAFGLVGDGATSLEDLIERYNAAAPASAQFVIDGEARQLMREQSAFLGEVVEAGKSIRLSNRPLGGGGLRDVRAQLHPGYEILAARIAESLESPLLSIDLITQDESKDPVAHARVLEADVTPNWLAYLEESAVNGVAEGIVLAAIGH